MKVLAVEDQLIARLALASALKSLGHEVTLANDGEAAWAALAADRELRVIVCDWEMPELDGLALCRRIRAKRSDYISFILLTQAESTDEHLQNAFAAGVDDFLSKPIDSRKLALRLHVAARIQNFTSEIKKLQSFIPICCYCKKIRDDKNYWQQIEAYIAEQTGTRFSHGICPDCYQREVIPQLRDADNK